MLNYGELDWKLIGAVLALSLIGVLLIMSAQYHADSDYRQTFYMRQLMWLLVALGNAMPYVLANLERRQARGVPIQAPAPRTRGGGAPHYASQRQPLGHMRRRS